MARVAVAQMLSGEDVAENLKTTALLVQQAASAGAELLLLPENFAMLDSKALINLAKEEEESHGLRRTLSDLALKHSIWIIAGSLPLLCEFEDGSEPKVFASCLVFDAAGKEQARYDKVHLFDVDVADAHSSYRESAFIEHGNMIQVVDTPVGRVGLSICYDLRFPEQYQKLRDMGAEILTVPSAFTYATGEAHWEVLLRARAIENQCYVLAANQGGEHSETRKSWGHSMAIDPWGKVLAQREDTGVGLVFADVDLDEVKRRRQAMPVIQHRTKAGF